jgi:hypothetical protein
MSIRPPPKGDNQPDLFATTFADIPIRDQRDTMERPFFSLAKRPRFAPIDYSATDPWPRTARPHNQNPAPPSRGRGPGGCARTDL